MKYLSLKYEQKHHLPFFLEKHLKDHPFESMEDMFDLAVDLGYGYEAYEYDGNPSEPFYL